MFFLSHRFCLDPGYCIAAPRTVGPILGGIRYFAAGQSRKSSQYLQVNAQHAPTHLLRFYRSAAIKASLSHEPVYVCMHIYTKRKREK